MSLYTRYHKPAIGLRGTYRINTAGEGLSRIITDSPLSSQYVAPVTTRNTKMILAYFRSVQVKQYGKSLDLADPIIISHIKQAFNKGYTPAYICRAIRYASTISRFVFSIPFATRSLDESGCEYDRPRSNPKSNISTATTRTLFD